MGSLSQESGKALIVDLSAIPGLPIVTPSSPDYKSLRATYALENQGVPLAIVRPQSAADVAAIIPLAYSHGIPISVRSGGHDVFGRSIVHESLVIDMRPVNDVHVSEDKQTAKIGGGALMGGLLEDLAKFDLVTPFGSMPSVGYVGWSSLGGYSALTGKYGLGCDQIVGAKVANWKGEIVEADPELLKGVRGGGGNFGIIVELTIKVYPLKKLLAGLVIFDSTDLQTKFEEFCRGLRSLTLPSELGISPMVINHPEMGRTLATTFVWSSDETDAGMEWLDRVQALSPALMNTVTEIRPVDWVESLKDYVPYGTWGGDRTVSLSAIPESVAKILAKHLNRMPSDGANGFVMHKLQGQSAVKTPSSCFGAREQHYMIEMIGSTLDKANMDGSQAWIAAMYKELNQCGYALKGEYFPLSRPGDCPVSDWFKDDWEFVMELKRKHDPEGVFNLAVPRLYDHYT